MSQEEFDFAGLRALENDQAHQRTCSQPLSQESQESDAEPSQSARKSQKFVSSSSEEEVEFTSDEEKENDRFFRKPIAGSPRKSAKQSSKKSGPVSSGGKKPKSKNVETDEEVGVGSGTAWLKDEREYIRYLRGLKINDTSHVKPALLIAKTMTATLPATIFKHSEVAEKYQDEIRLAVDKDMKDEYNTTLAFPNIMAKLAEKSCQNQENSDETTDAASQRKIEILSSLHCWMTECLDTTKSLERKAVRERNSNGEVARSTKRSLEKVQNVALDFQRYMAALPKKKKKSKTVI